MIEAVSLSKRYGRFLAVDGVSFKIERGEIVGLLGPNGAGKTTTIRILTGAMPSTSGGAFINQVDLEKNPIEAKRKIGYLPENVPLYPELTPTETLELIAGLHALPEEGIKERIEAILKTTGCLEVRGRPVAHLSKGYRQRLGMAIALLPDPEVVILDEPMIGLDPQQIVEFRDLIRGLRPNRAILLSSHILQDVTAICDRILIIHRGRIASDRKIAGLSTPELEAFFLDAISH